MLGRLREVGLIAVLRGASPKDTIEVAEALIEGGVVALEVAFTTSEAHRAMTELKEAHGESILLGAGTVTTEEQVELSVKVGAQFLVSPGLDPQLLPRMLATGLLALPGVLTPSEVLRARRLGAGALKLFPGSLGGPAHLKALRGPFPDVPFVPTGGVSAENAPGWFAAGAAAVGAGGSLAPQRLRAEIGGRSSREPDYSPKPCDGREGKDQCNERLGGPRRRKVTFITRSARN
jgi:2-dehydro-3-deoxyphosphogluconate aldolase/(4S)-4-hydroxy-2-oxoglutarate aldolase